MSEAAEIVNLVTPYLTYLGGPILIFSAIACADLIVDFAVNLMKQVRNGYR